MQRIAVIVGSTQEPRGVTAPTLPLSDRAAVGLAVKRYRGAVTAYCMPDDHEARCYALAAGVATTTWLEDIATLDFDLVLVGSGGAEPWGDLLPALLAEHRQCAMVFDVLDVEFASQGIRVTRDLGRGSREMLAISGPAVLYMAEEATQVVYVSRYRRQAVRAVLTAARFDVTGEAMTARRSVWEPVRPRAKTGHLAAQTDGSAHERLQALLGMTPEAERGEAAPIIIADAATCAQHLLRFLHHYGIIAASIPTPAMPGQSVATEVRNTRKPVTARRVPHGRGPRPVEGQAQERGRRPRPLDVVSSLPAILAKHRRAPRPLGQALPRGRRGPYPVTSATVGKAPVFPATPQSLDCPG